MEIGVMLGMVSVGAWADGGDEGWPRARDAGTVLLWDYWTLCYLYGGGSLCFHCRLIAGLRKMQVALSARLTTLVSTHFKALDLRLKWEKRRMFPCFVLPSGSELGTKSGECPVHSCARVHCFTPDVDQAICGWDDQGATLLSWSYLLAKGRGEASRERLQAFASLVS
jgi:hypothetical protein